MTTNSELRQSIGKRVHDFRRKNNYTQAQFAESIDISVNFLSEIENGKKGMSQETIYKLCSCFNISADYILFGLETNAQNTTTVVEQLLALSTELHSNELEIVIEYLSSLKKIKEIS